jgi:hypothetical protein
VLTGTPFLFEDGIAELVILALELIIVVVLIRRVRFPKGRNASMKRVECHQAHT